MPATGFAVSKTKNEGAAEIEQLQSVPNTQYSIGDMLTVTAGLATQVSAGSKGTHIYQAMITPASLLRPAVMNLSTALCEQILAEPVAGGSVVIQTPILTTTLQAAPCSANASLTSVVVPNGSGTTGDYVGGQLYIPELGLQRLITASVYASGAYTFTVEPPFPSAPTTGNTCTAVPFSKGATLVKFNATTAYQGIDCTLTGLTSGHNKIEDVDLKRMLVFSSCPDLQ